MQPPHPPAWGQPPGGQPHSGGQAGYPTAPGQGTGSPASDEPVPLVVKLIALSVLVGLLGGGAVLFWWVFARNDPHEDTARQFLTAMNAGHNAVAFSLLSTDLKQQVGSPAELGRRWTATEFKLLDVSWTCSAGGGGNWRLGFNGSYSTSFLEPKDYDLSLGTLSTSGSRCRNTLFVFDMTEENGAPKVKAFRLRTGRNVGPGE